MTFRAALLAGCCALSFAGCLTPKHFDENAWRARVEATREADLSGLHPLAGLPRCYTFDLGHSPPSPGILPQACIQ